MTLISKAYFESRVNPHMTCSEFIHPWTNSCIESIAVTFKHSLIGCVKFFIPIYIVQLLLDYKKINKNYPKQIAKKFCFSCAYGITIATMMMISNCTLSKLFGIQYYNLGLVSGFFAGTGIFFESKKNTVITTLIFLNLLLEAAVNNLEYHNILKFTKIKQTIIFMLTSSYLMYIFKNRKEEFKFTHFWFYVPTKIKNSYKNEKLCGHEEECQEFIKSGVVRYFIVGYMINVVKSLLSRFSRLQSPKAVIQLLLRKNNFIFGLCTSVFAGIYRFVSCVLAKSDNGEKPSHSTIAGFLAGIAYIIKPNIQFLIVAVSTILQVTMSQMKIVSKLPNSFPTYSLVFLFCNSLLMHNRLIHVETCPKNYIKYLKIGSNSWMDKIYASSFKRLL